MSRLRLLLRLLAIQRILIRHRLDELVRAAHLLRPVRFLFLLWPSTWSARQTDKPRGVRIREALEELGPIFVKFGQSLSTRQDLLPTDIGHELAKLQDEVPPFPAVQALAEVQRAFGRPASEVFASFEPEALAAASIAQVHAAQLHTGEDVVVKLLRPGVRARIEQDLEVMYALARLAWRYWPEARRLRPIDVVAEYEKTILNELDLQREAANASELRRHWQGSPIIYVPQVYWDFCRPEVMVLERIRGIPIDDRDALRRAGVNIPKLAVNGVEIFFTQVFRDNFFHADMHPGNIFVDASDPENPRYAAVDFGIVGSLEDRDREYLAENFLAFFEGDYYRVAKLHVDSGWVPPTTRVDELAAAVRTVCEPIASKPLKDISFGHVLVQLFSVARRFNMEVQPQLILLQKTLVQIEGLGRDLYPELDIWQTGKPILKGWMSRQTAPDLTLKRLRQDWPDVRYALERLPLVARRLVDHALDEHAEHSTSPWRRSNPSANTRSLYAAIAGGALLVAGALLLGLGAAPPWLPWATAAVGAAIIFSGRPRGGSR